MKKLVTLLVGIMMVFAFTACSSERGNTDKGNDGIIEDAGNAVNDALNGAENVIDDVTGSDNANDNNAGNNKASDNNSGQNGTGNNGTGNNGAEGGTGNVGSKGNANTANNAQ